MKRFLKSTKGFSMIELLVALLIMAVIAGIAIALFGNIVGTTKKSADEETSATIKKQILYYINQTNDTDMSMLRTGTPLAAITGDDLVDHLCYRIFSNPDANNNTVTGSGIIAGTSVPWNNGVRNSGDSVGGSFGPYMDGSTKAIRPQSNSNLHWLINIDNNQSVTVSTTNAAIAPDVTFN